MPKIKQPRPVATLVPVKIEVEQWRLGVCSYRWTEGRKIISPTGREIQPHMRLRDARAYCRRQGWDYTDQGAEPKTKG